MVRTIYQSSLKVNNGVACEDALLYGFLQTLFNCREVVLRNCSAEYLLFEYEFFRIVVGFELNPDVTVLAMAAGLLLVLTLDLDLLADSFTVRNSGSIERATDVVYGLELADDDLELHVAETRKYHLLCFRVGLN